MTRRISKTLLRRREAAANAYVAGNPDPLDLIVARDFPASFFGPGGGVVRGTADVASRYRKDAGLFSPEGESRFEIFEFATSDEVAYWTGLQHATARIGGGDLQPMVLVHRHADGQGRAWSMKPRPSEHQ